LKGGPRLFKSTAMVAPGKISTMKTIRISTLLVEIVAATHAGMSTEEFETIVAGLNRLG